MKIDYNSEEKSGFDQLPECITPPSPSISLLVDLESLPNPNKNENFDFETQSSTEDFSSELPDLPALT